MKDYSLDLKLNVHRCIGQFRRLPSPPRKTRLRRYFVQKWRSCEGNAYAHARRKDKDLPLNICRLRTGRHRTLLLVRNKVSIDVRTVILSITFANDRAHDPSRTRINNRPGWNVS